MRLVAHVTPDGSISGLVAQPVGKAEAMLIPDPGNEVCEITDHGLPETFDLDQITQLREQFTVEVTPSTGRLVRRHETPS